MFVTDDYFYAAHAYAWKAIKFCRFFFFSFRTASSVVTALNSTKLCRMFGREPDMKMVIQNLGAVPL